MSRKPGPKRLPPELKRRRITITLLPRAHAELACHRRPGEYVQHCMALARCITRAQDVALAERFVETGESVAAQVHVAVREYLGRLGTPNRSKT